MGECPHELEVGEPPSINACPDGWTRCACFRHLVLYAFGLPRDRTTEVVLFWQEHPNDVLGFAKESPE